MKYCVIKNTITVIDGSDNSDEIMRENALSAGIAEFEILAEEEYETRKALEPIIPQPMTDTERISNAEQALNMIMEML